MGTLHSGRIRISSAGMAVHQLRLKVPDSWSSTPLSTMASGCVTDRAA